MAHKALTTQEAIDLIKNDESFDDFAFRGDDFVPAKKFRNSRYHGDDEPEYKLNGVSAITVYAPGADYIKQAIAKARKYGNNVFLLAGKTASNYSGDKDEILMTEYRIIGIIND